MQLTQKYTINNISYTNELFIKDENTNVNIKEIIQHFFNSVQPVFNYSCSCHSKPSEVTNINTINNNEAEEASKPASEEFKKQDKQTGWQITGCHIKKANPSGFYIKFKVGNNIIEKWSNTDSVDKAKAGIYNYISKLRKERNDTVDYEFLELRPITLKEYNNRKSE